MSTHEQFEPLHEVKTSSDRSFGIVFGAFFLIVGVYLMLRATGTAYLWALAASALFFLAAAFAASVLAPLNSLWIRFGVLLHMIVSPIVLGVMFFLVVLPTGLVMRLLGKSPLPLRFDKEASTYWILRKANGVNNSTFRDQF